MQVGCRSVRIAVILACFNRKELTLRALRGVRQSNSLFAFSIFLFEDGSSDGTRESVILEFPEVTIVGGDGTAFWNGGMNRAWRRALEQNFDGYLWLNDDVLLDDDALERLHSTWNELMGASRSLILVGPVRASDGNLSYGGVNREFSPFSLRFKTLSVQPILQRSETFHGNIVLVSAETVKQIGINDPNFLHTLGDIDYGLRATKAGIAIYVMPNTLGVCEPNNARTFRGLSLGERFKRINTHLGLPISSWLRMTVRWSGFWMPFHFLVPYRKLFFDRKNSQP